MLAKNQTPSHKIYDCLCKSVSKAAYNNVVAQVPDAVGMCKLQDSIIIMMPYYIL